MRADFAAGPGAQQGAKWWSTGYYICYRGASDYSTSLQLQRGTATPYFRPGPWLFGHDPPREIVVGLEMPEPKNPTECPQPTKKPKKKMRAELFRHAVHSLV